MTGRLFIYGAGAHARKVFHYAVELGWQVAGFVDDRPGAVSPVPAVAILLPAALPAPAPDAAIFVAIGDPSVRSVMLDRLAAQGWRVPVLRHRTAWVAPDVQLGGGTLVAAGAIVETGSVAGRGVIIDSGVVVDHDCRIGDFCHLGPGTVLRAGSVVPSPV